MSLTESVFKTQIPFIKPTLTAFLVNEHNLKKLEFHIHSFSFMRKLFSATGMACYSMDAVTGKNGHCCCLCDWAYRCTKVIRLKIMVQNTPSPVPAMLDVNDHSFPSIETILETVPPDELHKTLITATMNTTSKAIKIDFAARF